MIGSVSSSCSWRPKHLLTCHFLNLPLPPSGAVRWQWNSVTINGLPVKQDLSLKEWRRFSALWTLRKRESMIGLHQTQHISVFTAGAAGMMTSIQIQNLMKLPDISGRCYRLVRKEYISSLIKIHLGMWLKMPLPSIKYLQDNGVRARVWGQSNTSV
jgi:hypothetical protein